MRNQIIFVFKRFRISVGTWFDSVKVLYGLRDQPAVREELKKQIPRLPTRYKDSHGSVLCYCPVCGSHLVGEVTGQFYKGKKYNYCQKCGQKINWSDVI